MVSGWPTSFHPLAKLRDLSNLDKHRSLVEVVVPPLSLKVNKPFAEKIFVLLFDNVAEILQQGNLANTIRPIKLHTIIARGPAQPALPKRKVDMVGFIWPHINFAEGGPVTPV